jgi:hypothetical protein
MAYIGSRPDNLVTRDSFKLFRYSATAGQTVFTGSDLNNQILSITPSISKVNMNGILLDSSDYTITSNTLTLTVSANAGDEVTITGFEAFEVSDTVSKSSGGIFSNPVTIDAAGSTVLTVDRATSDGTIIDVQKSGSSVGSIGTLASGLNIGTGDTGLQFSAANDAIYPFDPSSNNIRGDFISLGDANGRFTNLYLSGGAYLGGTGSSNKLDDYEEGTWTPVIKGTASDPSVTYGSARYGGYVKVGRQVTVSVNVVTTALSGGTGSAAIGGLPFAPSSDDICHTGALETDTTTLTANYTYAYASMFASNALIYYRQAGSGRNEIGIPVGNITGNSWQRLSITYFTDA